MVGQEERGKPPPFEGGQATMTTITISTDPDWVPTTESELLSELAFDRWQVSYLARDLTKAREHRAQIIRKLAKVGWSQARIGKAAGLSAVAICRICQRRWK